MFSDLCISPIKVLNSWVALYSTLIFDLPPLSRENNASTSHLVQAWLASLTCVVDMTVLVSTLAWFKPPGTIPEL